MATEEIYEKVALKLFECNAIKFGTFTLKSGITSPVYFDLRVIVSYPKLMSEVSELLYQAAQQNNCEYKSVCGVPYTALPLATIIGADHDVPMLIRRKEAKGYGTKKLIEGHYTRGDPCLIVEDVVTSGSSVMETVEALGTEGLVVRDAVVLLDREQGGKDMLRSKGINLHSVFGMGQLLDILHKHNALSDDVIKDVRTFIRENRTFKPEGDNTGDVTKANKKVLSYEERASHVTHPVAKRLLCIMSEKRTNLAFSVDVTSSEQLLKLADSVGPHICVLKTHVDILEDFSEDVVNKLSSAADKHNFLLFEDRKFADIGNTVKRQYGGGLYRISDWAHITNAHGLPGPGILQGLKEVGGAKDRGCLLLAEMSSKGNLATGDYTKVKQTNYDQTQKRCVWEAPGISDVIFITATVTMAQENSDFVMGFISVQKVTDDPRFIHMTPGVQLQAGGDALGQQYATPHDVITRRGSDVIIVGRGILEAPDAAEAARQYKEAGYTAYRAALEQ